LDRTRQAGTDIDMKATSKEFSFNSGGFISHNLFWNNLAPAKAKKDPSGALTEEIKNESAA